MSLKAGARRLLHLLGAERLQFSELFTWQRGDAARVCDQRLRRFWLVTHLPCFIISRAMMMRWISLVPS